MKAGNYSTLKHLIKDKILSIHLNRPNKRNALNAQMVKELHHVFLEAAKNDNIKGIILTGEGKAFCAGADLAYLQSLLQKSYQENFDDSVALKELYYTIYTFPKPTVAVVNGPAIAGGCGLMNVCDFAFAVKEAIFGYPEVKIGFVAAIVSVFLIQSIGYKKSKEMLLTGNIIKASEALDIGLIDRIIHKNEITEYSLDYIRELISNSGSSFNLTKKFINHIQKTTLETVLMDACRLNAESRQLPDFSEGVKAFIEKRQPKWIKDS